MTELARQGDRKTDVCLTIDIEFSINGAFANPYSNEPLGPPHVDCAAFGVDHGLPFILETLSAYGLRATFFVEALNRHYFGDEPMRRIAEKIVRAGQDVQLHLHPCWKTFESNNWQAEISTDPVNDSFAGLGVEGAFALIEEGKEIFTSWLGTAPSVLRTGNLQTDRSVYKAMKLAEIPAASNLGIGFEAATHPDLELEYGVHTIEGVTEIPVTTYTQFSLGSRKIRRLLTITASSFDETKAILQQANKANVSPIVLLTHPTEFVKTIKGRILENRVNKNRFTNLCAFLAENQRQFSSTTLDGMLKRGHDKARNSGVSLNPGLTRVISRMVQNQLNDRLVNY